MTNRVASTLSSNFPDEIKKLRVNSPGGQTGAAIQIARLLRSRGIEVEVDGVCQSACAYLLLPAAKKVSATPGSLILFHHTTTLVAELAGQHPSLSGQANLAGARAEHTLYKEVGTPDQWLYLPGLALQPQCVGMGKAGGVVMPVLFSREAYYVPTASEARELLPRATNIDWPTSVEDAQARARRLLGRELKLVRGLSPEAKGRTIGAQILSVPECPTPPAPKAL